MEQLYNVYALERTNHDGYGNYRSLVRMKSDDSPDNDINGHTWIRIGYRLTEDEAEQLMNQYPTVSRAKC